MSGIEEARANGYRGRTLGKRKCANCRFGGEEKGGRVYCRMFEFMAQARGVCDEWEAE